MSSRVRADVLLAATAPMVWGSSYLVATEWLKDFPPLTVALLRTLPAGLLVLAVTRQFPAGIWWWRTLLLGGLNIAVFQSMLFVAAYRLPGGVAATVAATQPLMAIFVARLVLGDPVRPLAVIASVMGAVGVAMLVLAQDAALDPIGIVAGLSGAMAMAIGTALTRKWQPPATLMSFTGWQLAAGGMLLLPVVLLFEPVLPILSGTNLLGLLWLGLVGAILAYAVWFRAIAHLGSAAASMLLLLSPVTAIVLGLVFLDQTLSLTQVMGIVLIAVSIGVGQRAMRAPVG